MTSMICYFWILKFYLTNLIPLAMAHSWPLSNRECLIQELDDLLALDSSTTSRHPPLQDKNTDLSAQVGKYNAQGAKGRSKKGRNSNSAKLPKTLHSLQNVEETLSVKAPENTNTLLQQLMGYNAIIHGREQEMNCLFSCARRQIYKHLN